MARGKASQRVTRREIDGMIETCIGMVVHGKTMGVKQYQRYRELIGKAAKERGTRLPEWESRWRCIHGRATNILIDASNTGLIANPKHKGIIKKAKMAGSIEMVLADLMPNRGYQTKEEIREVLRKSNPGKPLEERWRALGRLTTLDLGKVAKLKRGVSNLEYYEELERRSHGIMTRLTAERAGGHHKEGLRQAARMPHKKPR